MIKTRNLLWMISVVLLVVCLAACGGAKTESIRFDKAPRVVYVQGQEIDLANAVIVAVKGDKTEPINAADVAVSGYDKNVLGKQTVTFTYEEVSTSLDVTVVPRIEVEGAVRDYFVGDVFDQSKGRIRVANDLGEISTVALSDSGVTVSGFDSSKAGLNVPVTIEYSGYTGTINVNVYDVAEVKLTSYPTKTQYGSHETVFDVTGGFFTVSAAGMDVERYVELTADMIKNFDPSAATLENRDQALKQTVTISYLGHDFPMEISVKFSDVSLVQLRAQELASVTDLDNIPEDQGELALTAMSTYLALSNADKEFVSESDRNALARIAVVYGYARFLEAKDVFAETAELSAVEQENGEFIGMFKILASNYDAAKRDLALLKDEENRMVKLGSMLQSIKSRFGDLEIKDSKCAKEYMDLLYTVDGLDAAREILALITELHEELMDVDANWRVEDLVNYKSNIKTAVMIITGSEFNPFKAPPYIEVFRLLSKWRENDDYFDIIYAYYMEYEPDGVVDVLWEVVPMPEKLQNIHDMLVNAANKTANISIGGDLTEFYYYYQTALENEKAILNGDNQLHIDIYNKLNLKNLIKSYMFVGNNMNNIGYVYYVSSMVDNENFAAVMSKYLDILYGETANDAFKDETVQVACKELVNMYAALSPAEQYAFISAIYCDYRLNSFSDYLLKCTLDEGGEVRANSGFTFLLAKTYLEMLSDDGWDVFTRLLMASEANALRFRDDAYIEEFVEMMEGIIADAAKLPEEERATFASLLEQMTLCYHESVTPSAPNAGAYEDKLNELLHMMDKFFDVSYAMNNDNLSTTERTNMATLWLAIAEKAKQLENELLATGDADLLYTYRYSVYTFDTDRDGSGEDLQTTINFMMDEIRASQINMLVTTVMSDPRNADREYNGYNLYCDYDLREFLVSAVEIMYASFNGTADALDRNEVLTVLKSIRNMNSNTMFAFMMFNANAYFYDGVYNCLKANQSDEMTEMILALLSAEEQYVKYIATGTADDRTLFCNKMADVADRYEALEDKLSFADLLEMYNYYLRMYTSLKNA